MNTETHIYRSRDTHSYRHRDTHKCIHTDIDTHDSEWSKQVSVSVSNIMNLLSILDVLSFHCCWAQSPCHAISMPLEDQLLYSFDDETIRLNYLSQSFNSLSISVSLCRAPSPLSFSIYLSIYIFSLFFSLCVSLCLSISLSHAHYFSLYVSLSPSLFISLSLSLYFHLYVSLSLYL